MRSVLVRLMLIVTVALLPILLLQAYIESHAQETRQRLIQEEALRRVRLVNADQQRVIGAADQALSLIGSTVHVVGGDVPECVAILGDFVARNPLYLAAGVFRADGNIVCSTDPPGVPFSAWNRSFFQRALRSNDEVVGTYGVGRLSHQPTIHIAKSYRTADGSIADVAVVALNLQWLNNEVDTLPLPPGGTSTMTDRQGRVLAHNSNDGLTTGQLLPEADRFMLAGSTVGVRQVVEANDDPRMVAWSPPDASPMGLLVAVGLDADSSFTEVTATNRAGIFLIAAGGVLALALTALLGIRLIRRPVDRLLQAAERWGHGDLGARTGLAHDSGEFGRLAAAFDQLAEILNDRVKNEVAAREAAQIRAAQAERAQTLGQLAGGIAHDFNNVLQAVTSTLQLIARQPGDQARVARLAGMAKDAVTRGVSITSRLLTLGRRGDLRAEPIDVPSMLRGLHELLAHTLGALIKVSLQVGPNVGPVLADRGQLETVLINLATNARDAMPGGGRLVLAADAETVTYGDPPHPARLKPGRYIRLTVVDHGSGMDAETLMRAREPFFTTKQPGKGTGLGLALAHGFAEQSGGSLAIESAPGAGTTVMLWLPEATPAAAVEPPQTAAPPTGEDGRRPRILVVDDEPLIREVLAQLLEGAGYDVLVAACGGQALALAEGGNLDALITDFAMPEMDGLSLIRHLQADDPGLPVVLLTGYAGDESMLVINSAIPGAFSLLRKPASEVQLLDRLRSMLATRDSMRRRGAGGGVGPVGPLAMEAANVAEEAPLPFAAPAHHAVPRPLSP